MMVMWLNVEEARNHFLEFGAVYSLRPKRGKREGREVLSYRGFGKKGNICVVFIKKIKNDNELEEYVENSGFKSVAEWRSAAKESRCLYWILSLDDDEHLEHLQRAEEALGDDESGS